MPGARRVYVGGYTDHAGGSALGSSRGVESFTLDASSTPVQVQGLPPVGLPSPSYLIAHPELPILYAVTETDPSQVHEIRLADDGTATLAGSAELSGAGACHLCLDDAGRFLLVAHYGDGSVSSVALHSDGSLGAETDWRRFHGSGPVSDRQEHAHAHQVVMDHGVILVPDLGSDVIHQLRLDPEGHFDLAAEPIALAAGSGPRHLLVSEDHLLVACELSAQIQVFARDEQGWHQVSTIPSTGSPEGAFPSAFRGNGDDFYVANRGPDTFSVFTLDRDNGVLAPRAEVGTGGAWPRDLLIVDGSVWVANQNSDSIAVFTRELGATSRSWKLDFEVPTPSPACIVLLP